MSKYNNYDDEYEYDSYSKNEKRSYRKEKHKGHQSRSGNKASKWDNVLEDIELENDEFDTVAITNTKKPDLDLSVNKTPNLEAKPALVFGPNTHTIKNNQIDFDRVADMVKVEGDYNGKRTFGIMFIFSNKKRTSRTVWFSINERERDHSFNSEFSFWKSLQK